MAAKTWTWVVGGAAGLGLLLLLKRRAAASSVGAGERLVQAMLSLQGQPYVWGAESFEEGGFDCSGAVSWSIVQAGLKPEGYRQTAAGLAASWPEVDVPARGDLVFYAKAPGARIDHVEVLLDEETVVGARHSKGELGVWALPGPASSGRWGVVKYGRVV